MKINKASWVTEGDNVRLSMPFGKVDQSRRIVSGFASLDNLDKQMDIVTTEASMNAFAKFRGNIREMHQPSAVGKMLNFKEEKYFDPESKKFYKGVYVSTYISKGAQDAWEKVLDGTYTGFSIGGRMNKWDDAYDEKSDSQIRIIKDYDLVELSLVDSPANQFASILSVEKVDGKDIIKGDETVLENVFYDKESGIVVVSEEDSHLSPTTGEEMTNIGFVEKTDKEKVDMIKFLVDSAKGIHTSKITKEVNPMSETTEAVLDTAVETAEITPEAQPAEVLETPVDVEKTVAVEEVVAETSTDGSVEEVEVAAEDAAKSDQAIADAIVEIKESISNAFGDLASTVKSLHEQVVALNKSLETVSSEVKTVSDEVTTVKGTFNEFGKRVDAVEHDTAFRKSGDLGEIVQFEPAKVQKSLWGGRFLKSTDLFN
jgi:archaellum component FlaC